MSQQTTHALLITGSRSWCDEVAMKQTFNTAWQTWGPSSVHRPVLLSGHCPKGADAMAERLWRSAGFDVREFPADWDADGRAAGFTRNLRMVDELLMLREQGVQVLCAAFSTLCTIPNCRQNDQQQLVPVATGHFTHGTAHCRRAALRGGIHVLDVVAPPS